MKGRRYEKNMKMNNILLVSFSTLKFIPKIHTHTVLHFSPNKKKRATRLSNVGITLFTVLFGHVLYHIFTSNPKLHSSKKKKEKQKIVYKINKFYQRLLQWIQMEMGKEKVYSVNYVFYVCV